MRNWINQRFNTNFTEHDLASIKDFSLIWNIFEGEVCNTNFSTQSVRLYIIAKRLNAQIFNDNLQYFKQRYLTQGVINYRFPNLQFRFANQRSLVENVLLGNNTNNEDIILALILIVYRFRNNLFHGVKDMQQINLQRTNFENANDILQKLLN